MSSPSNLDREAFQQLLANAFAIQESQIHPQSLAAIMEVQRSLDSGKLNLDDAMAHIVESARHVANASGVAIALLKGDRLTYRAGSGISAAHIARQVTASLTVSADNKTSREILRVENAHTDKRIEADICRQFGAGALLILPIYHGRALAGIFDVRFEEAHRFQQTEIRTYRLMAEQIEAALFRAPHPQSEHISTPASPSLAESIASEALDADNFPDTLPQDAFVPPPEFMMLPQNEHSLYARCGAVLGDIGKLPLLQHCAALGLTLKERAKRITFPKRPQNLSIAAITKSPLFQRSALFASSLRQRAKHLTWPSQRRRLALVAVGVVLAFTAAIAYRSRSAASSAESSTLPAAQSSAAQSVDQRPLIPKPTPGKRASEMRLASAASQPVKSEKSRLKRVRVSPTEVDYIGEDVTVRFFNDKPAPKRAQLPRARVAHIGNDVTVRYFTPNQPTTRTASR